MDQDNYFNLDSDFEQEQRKIQIKNVKNFYYNGRKSSSGGHFEANFAHEKERLLTEFTDYEEE